MILANAPTFADQNKSIAKSAEVQSFAEYNSVAKTLELYLTAGKLGDGKLITTAFFDHAHIVGSSKGNFLNNDLKTFEKAVNRTGPAPEIQHHVAWIDISGPSAAAKVEIINWAGSRFTDYYVLFKKDDEWKISGKVYDSHSNN